MRPQPSRREALHTGSLSFGAAALFGLPLASAAGPKLSLREFQEQLVKTPLQTEGPFYPDRLPLDTDNDLLIINEKITPAVGEITHLTGKVLDINGRPIRSALVEIWQVDSKGAYLHKDSANHDQRDTNFQGYGRFTTTPAGEYYFRTIKPVPYPGRTPHIHVKVTKDGKQLVTTQCFIKGHPQNERDGILQGIKDPAARDSVIVEFAPLADSKIGELAAHFQIVAGL
jgi:protocatechuate 3,4-dioxygenase beta subunit